MTDNNAIHRIEDALCRAESTHKTLLSELEDTIREIIHEIEPRFGTECKSYSTMFAVYIGGRLRHLIGIYINDMDDTLVYFVEDSRGNIMEYTKWLLDVSAMKTIANVLLQTLRWNGSKKQIDAKSFGKQTANNNTQHQ